MAPDAWEEDRHVEGGRFRLGGVDAGAIFDMADGVVSAGREERVEEARAVGLEAAPGRDPLAAHQIAVDGALFEHEHRTPGGGEDGGHRPTGDASADNYSVV